MKRLVLSLAGALCATCVLASAARASEFDKYAVEQFSTSLSTTQAGAHPDFTTSFLISSEKGEPFAFTRDVRLDLPPGLFGNPQALLACTVQQLGLSPEESECPQDSQVGVTEITLGGNGAGTFTEPVYNLSPPGGDVARLGFFADIYPTIINVRVDPVDYGIVATVEGASATVALLGSSTTLWGIPAAASHDLQRITPEEAVHGNPPPGGRKSTLPETPFMTNPTSCTTSRQITLAATSYQQPGEPKSETIPFPQITGCGLLGFNPETTLAPTTEQGSTGSGLRYGLSLPSNGIEHANLLYDSEQKRAEVILPVGMSINPSQAVGLGVCSEADFARETFDSAPNEGCPESSKIGSVTAGSPVLAEGAKGSLYVAKPYENPFGSLLALYLTVKVPNRGVSVRLAGKVSTDPVTGQITAVFDDIPQLPVSNFQLSFREGARAPLITPPACGPYTALSNFNPWADPAKTTTTTNSFDITSGPNHGPCPTGGTPPFSPQVIAGTQNNAAGSYSPFYLRLIRQDGEQELTRFSTVMPPGLTGNLTGIPFCPDAAIEVAKGRTGAHGGAEEEGEASCPAASQIGHTLVGAGVGTVLAQTPGRLYLAGPYRGAPLSLVSVTSAKVGPFDLGTVVIRFALRINPITAQVEVDATGSDPIPHIIDGIVVHVRDISAYIDRPNFIINPTSCEHLQIQNAITGAGASFTSLADDVSVTLNSPFQAADCSNLAFKPSFNVSTSGKTSKANGASLTVKLAYPTAPQGTQANIRSVKVDLPKQLPSRLTTLQKACTAAQFHTNPAGCPAASVIGHARAITPILPVPLEGPAYFVSNGGEAFPNLIMVLQGYGITIDLVGNTFISKTGITSSTFKAVPDQPVSSFELVLPQGPYSALTANGNLCASKLVMPTEFVGQNGMLLNQGTRVSVTGCPRTKVLTRAQKLALALKACHKKHGAKRAACEHQARKKYGPVKKGKRR